MINTFLPQSWQSELANAISDPQELLTFLELDSSRLTACNQAIQQFPLRVPRGFAARMKKGDPNDPLFRQVFAFDAEMQLVPGFSTDPLQEKSANPAPGLLHKYRNRVLLIVTGACAIHCRYCFRRHFPYADNTPGLLGWQQAIDYIATHPEINEVILSGGDPFVLKDSHLEELIEKIAAIKHIKRLRIHTRLPIVLPERITPALIQILSSSRLQPVIVVHCNHPNEIDSHVKSFIDLLRDANISLFNQSVLLKGVNDSAEILMELSEALFSIGIVPYYLHLLDKVQGAAHFEVTESLAKKLIQEMQEQLPGYLVPKLVREEPYAKSKIIC